MINSRHGAMLVASTFRGRDCVQQGQDLLGLVWFLGRKLEGLHLELRLSEGSSGEKFSNKSKNYRIRHLTPLNMTPI